MTGERRWVLRGGSNFVVADSAEAAHRALCAQEREICRDMGTRVRAEDLPRLEDVVEWAPPAPRTPIPAPAAAPFSPEVAEAFRLHMDAVEAKAAAERGPAGVGVMVLTPEQALAREREWSRIDALRARGIDRDGRPLPRSVERDRGGWLDED